LKSKYYDANNSATFFDKSYVGEPLRTQQVL